LNYALRRLRLENELSEDAVFQQLTVLNRDELKPLVLHQFDCDFSLGLAKSIFSNFLA